MKRTKPLFLLLLAAILLPFTTMSAQDVWDGTVATEFAGGTGTESDPYLIETGAQLAYLAQQTNQGYFLNSGQNLYRSGTLSLGNCSYNCKNYSYNPFSYKK